MQLVRRLPRGVQQRLGLPHVPLGSVPSSSSRRRLRARCVLPAAAAAAQHHTASTTTRGSSDDNQQQQQQQLLKQWCQQSSIYYSNYPLHRAAEARTDEARLAAWFNAAHARATPIAGGKVLLRSCDSSPDSISSSSGDTSLAPVWVSPAAELGGALAAAGESGEPPLFLGLDDAGVPHFVVQVSQAVADGVAAAHGGQWRSARTAGPDMAREDAAVMAVASGLAAWNADSQFHGATGAQTTPQAGGFSRRCSSSGRVVYPRIDPAIITLVTCGPDWCLLGRKAGWPAGRYSTLAGFLELGESLEQALCREVLEESGVAADLDSVRYVASQPWPFPRSLMVAFYAEAAAAASSSSSGTEGLSHQGRMAMMDTGMRPEEVAEGLRALQLQQPQPQEDEMEDVRWFHRDWLLWALQAGQAAAPSGFFIPGPYSLAHKLITGWLGTSTNGSSSSSNGGSNGSSSNGSSNGSSSSSSSWVGDRVPQVEIDQGVFKYVLLRLTDASSGRSKLLVRGSTGAAYHNHILQHAKAALPSQVGGEAAAASLDVQVLGGGRIEHYPEQRTISVYGYSAAFGPAVHEVTAGLVRKWHPWASVTHSYDGY